MKITHNQRLLAWLIFGLAVMVGILMLLPHVTPESGGTTTQQKVVTPSADTFAPLSQNAVTLNTGNPANDRLLALPEHQQAEFLGMAAQEGCVGARAFYMGMYSKDDSAFWSVGCTDGRNYAIKISSDASGSTKVLECSMLKLVANVNCFEKFNKQ